MRLLTPPFIINDTDSFADDIFERKEFATSLTNIIKHSSDPLAISLDGNWGEGKSTFVKMWQKHLDTESMPNIYIDAFSNDHTDDAFMVVASAITDYAKTHTTKDKTKELVNKTKKVGAQLLSWGAKISIKALTLGVMKDSDIEDITKIGEDISNDLSSAAEELIAEKLNTHKKDIESIESFKEFLSALPPHLSTSEDKLPLTIIIDELDRCRPSFAIEMLEKIKHLFSVENIVFILVMNKKQIEESIRSTYGTNIDAHTYLQKFVNIETSLPRRSEEYRNDIFIYCERLQQLHDISSNGNNDLARCMSALGNHFDLSLRQLEKSYSNVVLTYMAFSQPADAYPSLLSFFSILKVKHPELFIKASRNKATLNDLLEVLIGSETAYYKTYIQGIIELVSFCFLPENEYNALPENDRIKRFEARYWSSTRNQVAMAYISPLLQFSIR